jgi:hypothetical protein
MSQVKLNKKVNQEKQLDFLQSRLSDLLHQVETNISSYQKSDVRALRSAYIALDAVTLLTEKELDERKNHGVI